jgi:hypothetical protein
MASSFIRETLSFSTSQIPSLTLEQREKSTYPVYAGERLSGQVRQQFKSVPISINLIIFDLYKEQTKLIP